MRWLHSALPLCVRHGNIGKALPWFTVFSKAQRIFMTNPLRAWVRGCCAFTSGDNENRPRDISITALRELNISGKLLRCLNIPGECQNERSWRKWVSFFALFIHLSSFGSQLNPSFILTSRVKVLVYACPIMSNKNRSRIKITCFKGLEKWEATSWQCQNRSTFIFKEKEVRKLFPCIRSVSVGLIYITVVALKVSR